MTNSKSAKVSVAGLVRLAMMDIDVPSLALDRAAGLRIFVRSDMDVDQRLVEEHNSLAADLSTDHKYVLSK